MTSQFLTQIGGMETRPRTSRMLLWLRPNKEATLANLAPFKKKKKKWLPSIQWFKEMIVFLECRYRGPMTPLEGATKLVHRANFSIGRCDHDLMRFWFCIILEKVIRFVEPPFVSFSNHLLVYFVFVIDFFFFLVIISMK